MLGAGDAFDGTRGARRRARPDDPLRGPTVALGPASAPASSPGATDGDEWAFATSYDRETVVECALLLMARMEPPASAARGDLGDHLGELRRPARRAASARLLGDAARRPGSPRRSARRPRTGARGRPRRGWRRPPPALDRASSSQALERARARHRLQRVGERLRVLVGGEPLVQDLSIVSRHASGTPRVAVGLDEALDAAVAQPVGQRVPALQVARAAPSGVVRGRDDDEPGDAVGVVEREPDDRVRAHRGAGQHGAVDPAVVEHGEQVAAPAARSRSPPGRRRRRAAVAAGVVGDHAVAGALERPRAHHHVAAGRGQAVQQHDRDALAPPPRPASATPSR